MAEVGNENKGFSMKSFGEGLLDALFTYETEKVVAIKHYRVGFLNRFLQIGILAYIVGYVIIYKKGYQEFDSAVSAVSTKVKGVAVANFSGFKSPLISNGMHIFDSADYVIPPQQSKEFFVATNLIITPNQTRGTCPESPDFKENHCNSNKDCVAGELAYNGHGFYTGECVKSDQNPKINVCEVYSWCPVELNELPMPGHGFKPGVPLLRAENFTVLIKNYVFFPKFKFSRKNIIQHNNTQYLKRCQYHHHSDPLCPNFKLGSMVKEAGANFNALAYQGGVMAIQISWDCNLDLNKEYCKPMYSFKRIDDPDALVAPGFNFRYATYFVDKGREHRILYKVYGIRFEILINGKAGKFSVVPLFLNFGSGLALLAITSVCCDILVLYCLKGKRRYKRHKYHKVESGHEQADSFVTDTHLHDFDYRNLEDENE